MQYTVYISMDTAEHSRMMRSCMRGGWCISCGLKLKPTNPAGITEHYRIDGSSLLECVILHSTHGCTINTKVPLNCIPVLHVLLQVTSSISSATGTLEHAWGFN